MLGSKQNCGVRIDVVVAPLDRIPYSIQSITFHLVGFLRLCQFLHTPQPLVCSSTIQFETPLCQTGAVNIIELLAAGPVDPLLALHLTRPGPIPNIMTSHRLSQ